MSNEWIDARERLPQNKTWVEVIFNFADGDSIETEWFYWTGGSRPDRWPNSKITHWRYITHSLFNPIIEAGYILELPTLIEVERPEPGPPMLPGLE